MAIIIQQPDSLSFSGNLKKFLVNSESPISVQLNMGDLQVFDLTYVPGSENIIEIDLRKIIEKLLVVGIPSTNDLLTEQALGVADFTVTIDALPVEFRVVKGGVAELQSQAGDFMDANLLSWQPQSKRILQVAPEWIGIYATASRVIKAKAYFPDQSTETISLCTAAADKLWSVNVSWSAINDELTKKNPVAWDIWMEDDSNTVLSYVQRYQLRNPDPEETLYLWCNTLGGIDSVSFTGYLEDDKKLEHKVAELLDESLDEYQVTRKREIKQSTGYLTTEDSRWLEDFFISPFRYRVREDGAIKRIAISESKVIASTADDLHDFEFTYRYADDPALLNLDRTLDPLPAPEGLTDFFLTELLSGLTTALYQDNLYLAVQSPFALGWQKLSFAQLWESALPLLVDNETILLYDGKLRTNSGAVVEGRKPKHGFEFESDCSLSFLSPALLFSITAVDEESNQIRVWNNGKLLKKVTETIDIQNIEGLWYIYYSDVVQGDNSVVNTMLATMEPWNRKRDIPIAQIRWDGQVGVLRDYRYVCNEINHSPLVRFEDKPHPADDIYTDVSKFLHTLSISDTDVQKALEKLDSLLKVTVIEFENTSEPALENYHENYFPRYGVNPNLRLVIYDGENELPLFQAPTIYKTAGVITRIAWYLAGESFNGKILISR